MKTFPSDAPILVEVRRGSVIESRHRGWIVVCDNKSNVIRQLGRPLPSVYVRSSLKPFQILPLIINGVDKKFGLTSEELAVIMSSHSGEKKHTETVYNILKKINLDEKNLKCGYHPPLHKDSALELYKEGKEPCSLHSNCSGKHSGMLASCQFNGWKTENYLDYNHPVQASIREAVSYVADIDEGELNVGIDGCGAPVYNMPLEKVALLYARLADPGCLSPKYVDAFNRITYVMTKHPYLIAGEGRFDTDFMTTMQGKVVGKGGSEAVCGIALLEHGLGIAIKIEDGNKRAIGPVVLEVLKQLNLIDAQELESLKKWHHPLLYNFAKTLVGEIIPVFKLRK